MVSTYLDAVQPARALRDGEVQTHEGGIAHQVDIWQRLRRFLILGTEGGNFYTPQQTLTIQSVDVVKACANEDAGRTLRTIVDISESGRAPKNEPAILALAMMTVLETHRDNVVRAEAFGAVPRVCRTGTHLLHFAAYRKALGGGWGRGMRSAVGVWFADKSPRDMAYQAVKYPSRDGWALADLLRLAHPKFGAERSFVAKYIVDGWTEWQGTDGEAANFLNAVRSLGTVDNAAQTAWIIRNFRVPREAVPTEMLNDPAIWDALLADMPMTAMIRNLGKMTSVGLIAPGSVAAGVVAERLMDSERLRKARVHPITLLNALRVYEQGRGDKGSLTWRADKLVVNALDAAFYLAFGAVEPTNKRMLLALDVSSSMDGNRVAGMNLTAREASAALALVTAAVEPHVTFVAYSDQLVQVELRPSMRLDEVMRTLRAIPFGGTYCSLPIVAATEMGHQVDMFASFTDNETADGGSRYFNGLRYDRLLTASDALRQYRERSGIPARHAVVAFSVNEFSIADPNDPGMLDLVGLDSATPQLLHDFALGLV